MQKLECRPVADTTYMKLKLESIKKASVPQRKVQPLDKIVQTFKPISKHKHDVSRFIVGHGFKMVANRKQNPILIPLPD